MRPAPGSFPNPSSGCSSGRTGRSRRPTRRAGTRAGGPALTFAPACAVCGADLFSIKCNDAHMTSDQARAKTVTPPAAERRPRVSSVHDVTLTDDYAWLKDANWQQVLREPSALAADIRRHLEAENSYTEAILAGAQDLQKQPVAKMRARI